MKQSKSVLFLVLYTSRMPLWYNLKKALYGKKLSRSDEYIPQSLFLGLLGTGDGGCVASRGSMALEGHVSYTGWLHLVTLVVTPEKCPIFRNVDVICILFYSLLRLMIFFQYLWDLKDWIDRKWIYNYTDGLPTMDAGITSKKNSSVEDEGFERDTITLEEKSRRASKPQQSKLSAGLVNNPVATSIGREALAILEAAPMRCGGCGAKVSCYFL